MSGDGTYIEYRSGGSTSKGGGGAMPPRVNRHPPVTDDPHDPLHYYQGTDGRWYYTPDGNPHPEFGQPPPKKTLEPKYFPVKQPELHDKWGHTADKGYKMTPDDLRNLATALEQDVTELTAIIQREAQPKMNPSGAVGQDWQAGKDFTALAGTAQTVFSGLYGEIINTYNNVISLLRTTANNGQNGEDRTHHAVTNSGGGNKAL
jgi:hypothetical protein